MPRRRSLRRAFTLVELLVVIAIAGVLAAITLGGYRSIGEGQSRTSCQTNLTQIYSALRLYSADANGFMPYYDPNNTLGNGKKLGLWALYALPSNGSGDVTASLSETLPGGHVKPIGTYLRNPKQLHCPADVDHEDRFDLTFPNQFDMSYLSYQVQDGSDWTYQTSRTTVQTDPLFSRQLMRYPGSATEPLIRTPDDRTVITWCIWHRGAREIDNVLFYDGSVHPTPKEQPSGASTLTGWKRVP